MERSLRIRFVAVTNTFESLVFFAGVTALVLFLYRLLAGERLLPLVSFGGTVIALALLAIASSPAIPKEVQPPIPALQSYWLVLHVTLSFIGESFFIVSFVASHPVPGRARRGAPARSWTACSTPPSASATRSSPPGP